MNLDFIDKFEEIVNDANFELIKAWMVVSNILTFSAELTEELRVAGGAFGRALQGIAEAQSQEKQRFIKLMTVFHKLLGSITA